MATWLSGVSKHHRTIRVNAFFWFGLFVAVFLGILVQLFVLQFTQHAKFRAMADKLHIRTVQLRADRGKIVDRNDVVIAFDDERHTLFVDPTLVKYPGFLAAQLAPVLEMPSGELLQRMTQGSSFVIIQNSVEAREAQAIRRLALPGVQVQVAGSRYRIGLDVQAAPRNAGIPALLARTLDLAQQQVDTALGDLMQTPADDEGNPARQGGVRWLPGTFTDRQKAAVQDLHFPGMLYQQVAENYLVGVDPRVYSKGALAESVETVAAQLAPLVKRTQEQVRGRLTYSTRYVILKRDMTSDMQRAIARMQGTMFVTEPGKLLAEIEEDENPSEVYENSVDRLDKLLNGEKKSGAKPLVSRHVIRERLASGAAPGVLAVKLVESTQASEGKPDLRISYSLYNNPIPGVMYGMPGLGVQREPRRYYPYQTMAASVLGWVGDVRNTPRGVFGIEATEETQLRGINGKETMEVDNWRRTLPDSGERIDPINGLDIKVTLDLTIQQAAEEVLAAQVKKTRALQGECLVLDIKTGEILAMATVPSWDANRPGNSPVPLVNTAVSNFYEPGSTFKVVPVTAALESGLLHDGQTVLNCTGHMSIGRRTINEAHGSHGPVTCETLIAKSCNIGAAQVALKIGADNYLEWMDKFGFGQRTGIELANESPGSLNRKNIHARITLANMGFGQSLAVTPVQMAAFYAALANGGVWIQPHLVKSRQLPDRQSWQDVIVQRRTICSPETAKLMMRYLEKTVTDGTGKHVAEIDGYRVGGKTGTAQKPSPQGGYKSGKYIGSFIGVMPIDDPRLVIVAIIDEPKGSIYGGVVAGPVFQEVGRRALTYLNVPPTSVIAE